MEQKKVQRIIGILVVISLVIIVMPLLFGKNFPVQEAANIKAPPFPDQPANHLAAAAPQSPTASVPASTVATTTVINQDSTSASTVLPAPPILTAQTEKPVADNNSASTSPSSSDNQTVVVTPAVAKKVNDDSAAPAASSSTKSEQPAPAVGSVIYEPVGANAPVAAAPVQAVAPNASKQTDETAPITRAEPVMAKPKPVVAKVKSVHATALHAKAKIIPLNKSGSSAWVVQVGNFAVKKNAVHLTNVLNAAGYKAFIHDVKTKNGKINTRVYIGPESREAQATQLTGEINHKLNLQAFVVSFKSIKV